MDVANIVPLPRHRLQLWATSFPAPSRASRLLGALQFSFSINAITQHLRTSQPRRDNVRAGLNSHVVRTPASPTPVAIRMQLFVLSTADIRY